MYRSSLRRDKYDRQVYLRIKSEKLNCDVELPLDSIYKRDYLGRTRDEIVFEFSDEKKRNLKFKVSKEERNGRN